MDKKIPFKLNLAESHRRPLTTPPHRHSNHLAQGTRLESRSNIENEFQIFFLFENSQVKKSNRPHFKIKNPRLWRKIQFHKPRRFYFNN